jgi:cytochrome c peroxidase
MSIEIALAATQKRRISAFVRYALVPHAKGAPWKLERFSNSYALTRSVEGGFFLRKKPLSGMVSVYSNRRTAIAGAARATSDSYSSRIFGRRKPAGLLLAVLAGTLAILTGCRGVSLDLRPAAGIAPQQLYMFSSLSSPPPATGLAALRVDLGRRLYYDAHLSKNSSISCNSCHQLAKYGVDPGKPVSLGHDQHPGGRNSPTVYNSGLQFAQFWDGRAATLAEQASGPMMNPVEMGMSGPGAVLAYIHSNPEYIRQFRQAYPGVKDPVLMDNVTDAIAVFEGGLLTPARWDKYLDGDTHALTDQEKAGLHVYLRSGCDSCHAGRSMGGNSYQKLGVYRNWPEERKDPGRLTLTGQPRDQMYFKVPILRNVAQTGPWFHDGHVQTLEEAVRLMGKYESGHELSEAEVNSIVSFLHTLTGDIPWQYIQPPSGQAPPLKIAEDRNGPLHKMHLATQSSSREGE